ncbi:MAG: PhoU domain-containing protein [Myxococcales bacterium]|nr:PhoU domain-containing protein [Myxococcales bacterium]
MIKDLLTAFGAESSLSLAADDFQRMTELARDMTLAASAQYWAGPGQLDTRSRLERDDVRMNQLQRSIRRRVFLHLSAGEPADAPYCLALMSLVKDIERVGDYAKNLVAVPHMVGQADTVLPTQDSLVAALREFALGVEQLADAAPAAYKASDPVAIRELLASGKRQSAESVALLRRVARDDCNAALATRLTLTIRFYKRIQGHFMNLLASVLIPPDRMKSGEGPDELRELAC